MVRLFPVPPHSPPPLLTLSLFYFAFPFPSHSFSLTFMACIWPGFFFFFLAFGMHMALCVSLGVLGLVFFGEGLAGPPSMGLGVNVTCTCMHVCQ